MRGEIDLCKEYYRYSIRDIKINKEEYLMRRVFSLLLSLVVFIASVNIVMADGVYSGGTGSEQDPYLITTEDDLRLLASQVNKGNSYEGICFRLENDITLTSSWTPIGIGKITLETKEHVDDGSLSFRGVFDGNGHTVSNVIINKYRFLNDADKKQYLYLCDLVGFFGYTYNAVIKNLTIDGRISGNERVGGIVGYAANGTYISGCKNKAIVLGENKIGGIVGEIGNGTIPNGGKVIDNCVNEGEIYAQLFIYKSKNPVSQGVGGLVGYMNHERSVVANSKNNGIVYSSYTLDEKPNENWVECNHYDGIGGIVGYVNAGTVESCENSGAVCGERRVGGIVGTLNAQGKVNNSGSIKNIEDTRSNASQVLSTVFSIALTSDGEIVDAMPYNRYSYTSMCFGGVVGTNEGGTITNCYVKDFSIRGNEQTGGIVGHNVGSVENSTVENSTIEGKSISYESDNLTITPYYAYTGGIVGYNMSVIDGCTSKQNTVSSLYNAIGGICGYDDINSDTLIKDCKTINCTITRDAHYNTLYNSFIGGIAGVGKNIENSWVEGDSTVVLGHEYVGGVVGRNIGLVSGCHNLGTVTGDANIGGIIGENVKGAKVSNCYNERFFSGKGTYLGGVVGLNKGTVESCYNTGAIEISGGLFEHAGGVVGKNDIDAIIDRCYNEANIKGKNNIGGILGINDNGTVKNCYNEGVISGQDKVGGIVGFNEWLSATDENPKSALVMNNFNKGKIAGNTDTSNVGGITGINQGYIDNCYNSGEVEFTEARANYCGLISGNSPEHSKIINSYSKEYEALLCGNAATYVIDTDTVYIVSEAEEGSVLKRLNDYVSGDLENNLVDWGYINGSPELLLNGEKSNIARVNLNQIEGGTVKFSDTDDVSKFIQKGSDISIKVTLDEGSTFFGLLYSGGFISVDSMSILEAGVYSFKLPDEFDITFVPVFEASTFITAAKCMDNESNIITDITNTGSINKISVNMTTTNTSLKSDVIIVSYDNSDMFNGVVSIRRDCGFDNKEVTWEFNNINIPEGTSKLKIFVWDSINDMHPISNNVYTVYFSNPYIADGLKLQLDKDLSKCDSEKWYNFVGGDYYILNNVDVTEEGISFNGKNAYAESNDVIDMGSADRTIEISLANSNHNTNRNSYIFGMGLSDKDNLLIGLNKTNDLVIYTANSLTKVTTFSGINGLSLTIGKDLVKVYINGEFVNEYSLQVNTSGSKIKLGNSSNIEDGVSPDRYWKGDINIVRIYDRVLSSDEVKSNYLIDSRRFSE